MLAVLRVQTLKTSTAFIKKWPSSPGIYLNSRHINIQPIQQFAGKCTSEGTEAIKGKVGLVTGASLGIGQSCAKELLRCGAKNVMLADINVSEGKKTSSELNKEFGADKTTFIKCDVTNPQEIEGAFKATVDKWKEVNIVVNNAGILKDSNWELCIAINVISVVRGSLLAIKYMGKNSGKKGGVVVNVASILGLQHFTGCPVYVGTKHFVVGFDRSIGTPYFYDMTGIRFLTLCPGVTYTPLISEADHSVECVFTGFPGLEKILQQGLKDLPPQSSDDCGRAFIAMIAKGENGSTWVSEAKEAYEVMKPDRKALRK